MCRSVYPSLDSLPGLVPHVPSKRLFLKIFLFLVKGY